MQNITDFNSFAIWVVVTGVSMVVSNLFFYRSYYIAATLSAVSATIASTFTALTIISANFIVFVLVLVSVATFFAACYALGIDEKNRSVMYLSYIGASYILLGVSVCMMYF